eukprot:Pgem_evm1s20260
MFVLQFIILSIVTLITKAGVYDEGNLLTDEELKRIFVKPTGFYDQLQDDLIENKIVVDHKFAANSELSLLAGNFDAFHFHAFEYVENAFWEKGKKEVPITSWSSSDSYLLGALEYKNYQLNSDRTAFLLSGLNKIHVQNYVSSLQRIEEDPNYFLIPFSNDIHWFVLVAERIRNPNSKNLDTFKLGIMDSAHGLGLQETRLQRAFIHLLNSYRFFYQWNVKPIDVDAKFTVMNVFQQVDNFSCGYHSSLNIMKAVDLISKNQAVIKHFSLINSVHPQLNTENTPALIDALGEFHRNDDNSDGVFFDFRLSEGFINDVLASWLEKRPIIKKRKHTAIVDEKPNNLGTAIAFAVGIPIGLAIKAGIDYGIEQGEKALKTSIAYITKKLNRTSTST